MTTHAEPGTHDPARAQPETLRMRSVSPMMTVNDVAASAAWYLDVLGCMKVGEWFADDGSLSGVTVRAGAATFNLIQDDFEKGRDRPKGVGFRLYCTTAQDIDAVAAQIKERGGTLDHEPRDMSWGARVFALTDPDGFKLSISTLPADG